MRYNTVVQNELDNSAGAPGNRDGALFKIGIDQNSYISVWYYDSGRSNDWILTSRRNTVTAAGNYFLVIKLWDGNNVLVDIPERTARPRCSCSGLPLHREPRRTVHLASVCFC